MSPPIISQSRYRIVPYQYYAQTGSGHTPSRFLEEYWQECDIPWVTTADVKHLRDGHRQVLEVTELHISELGMANSAARLHPAGTVVLSRTASVGFSAIMGRPMATSQDFATWTPGSELESRYLLWVLRAMQAAGMLDRLTYGTTHKTIYLPDLQQLRGPLPPLTVQRRIADFLDTETARIDALISMHQRLLALAMERHMAEISSLTLSWLSGAGGTRTGEIRALGTIARYLMTGRTPPTSETEWFDGEVEWVGPSDIPNRGAINIQEASRSLTCAAITHKQAFVAPVGSVYVVCIGATVGRAGYVDRQLTSNQQITAIVPVDGIWGRFLAWQLDARTDFLRETAASATIPIITNADLRRVHVWIPDVIRQKSIAAALDHSSESLMRLRKTVEREVALLGERRQALITAAVTGQIEV